MAAEDASTGNEFSPKQFPGKSESESMSTEAICPTKRKAPMAGKNKENDDSSGEDEEGKGISNNEENGSDNDDDESMTESEFAAFYEEVSANYRKF
jgi:hypothetical protein